MTKKKPDTLSKIDSTVERNKMPEADFTIVGIGASAGGLGALQAFFKNMPAGSDSGMAFVLVQHLPAAYKSNMGQLLRHYTSMPVIEIEDGMVVMPDNIYIIPPNRNLSLQSGRFQLCELEITRGASHSIDYFLRSLARDRRERAICILLSGTGSDGTLGLKAIKGEGGMAMVQDPGSAEYDSMPRSAIATGLVDLVLPPQEMPPQLIAYVRHPYLNTPKLVSSPDQINANALLKIYSLLRAQTGHDFSGYKQNTLGRRIERRLAVKQIERLDDYIRYLEQNPLEVKELFREFLIGVTSFFRDAEAFVVLKNEVIPRLFNEKSPGDAVRVWVPGCSSGEEAYSIAMLIQEHLDVLKAYYQVQIFATDIDSRAIEQARSGIYPASIADDISPERLARFFTPTLDNHSYQIKKTIRDMLIFAEQNVFENPPFSRLDMVSCRNLLIYMNGELQKKVLYLFQYALNRDGFLFLGSSETLGEFMELFNTIDQKYKIYQSKGIVTPRLFMKKYDLIQRKAVKSAHGRTADDRENASMSKLIERVLLRQFAPACVVINERGEILYIHGRTGKYLEPAQGEMNMNILQMAREGLRLELTTAMRKAMAQKVPVYCQGLRVRTNGAAITVNLTVSPITEDQYPLPHLLMVVFEEVKLPEVLNSTQEVAAAQDPDLQKDAQIVAMERELRNKEEHLQTIIEQLETSNEEYQSTNEEFQSTNEELETSREELQSVNEELSTVNAELLQSIEELSRSNNDMHNMLAGTGVGTVFVDLQQRIKRFTPPATKVINLIDADLGRPLGHISANIVDYDHLVEDVQAVLDTLKPQERQLKTRDGLIYLMRILPYRTLENVIEGAVLTFVDITVQQQLQGSANRLAVVVKDASDAVTVLDYEGRFLAWNPGAQKLYGWSEAEALSMTIHDVVPEAKQKETLAVIKKLAGEVKITPFQTQRLTRDGTIIDVWLTATPLINKSGETYAIAVTERGLGKG